jgi:hypothetical protein
VVEVLRKTHCYVDIGELTLVAGTKDYRLDNTVLAILGRTIETSTSPITVVPLDDMVDMRRGGAISSPARYIAAEGSLLFIYPTPQDSGEIIRFYYVPRPSLMTGDSDDPSNATFGGIPQEFHRAIEYYMLWQGAEYDDKASPLKPTDLMALFEKECRDVRRDHRKKLGRGLAPSRVGYPGSARYPRRNDVYP